MNDGEFLAELLETRKAESLAEVLALARARGRALTGVDPAEVIADLEAQRDKILDLAALEREHGVGAVFELVRRELDGERSGGG